MSYTLKQLYDAVEEYGGYRPAARHIGVPESTIRRKLKDYEPDLPDHAFIPDDDAFGAPHVGERGVEIIDYWAAQQATKPGVRRYLLTSAQNNAEVHGPFLENLQAFAKHIDAQLLVSFCVYDRQGYRGVLARKGDQPTRRIWWDKKIEPYVCNERARLHRRLAFCGELDILATAAQPLSGMDAYCGRSSVIVPHNRFAMKCVPSRKHQMPKEMYTTGSVTVRKFIQRKTGQLAQFHHVLGALLVEVTDDGFFHVHHLNAEDDGSFMWLDHRVADGVVYPGEQNVEALVLGDIHHEKLDPAIAQVTLYDEDSVVRTLFPYHLIVHDLIDFRSRNHHNRDTALFKVRMACEGVTVEDELKAAAEFLDRLDMDCEGDVVVVNSNHDDAYRRWVKDADWKQDPVNARFYLETALAMVKATEAGESLNPLEWFMREKYGISAGVTFLGPDDSYEVKGIECGMHGHIGANGSRGNPRQFSKLGFKTFTAHTHTPGIIDGCYTVGVMGKLHMGYNVGPSSWMNSHGVIYDNGKRAFIQIKNGRWRAPLKGVAS